MGSAWSAARSRAATAPSPLLLVAVEERLVGAAMPGHGQFPGEVVGVPEALVEAVGAECAEQMCRVPGEEDAADPPAPGQPVVDGVDAGVEQLVRRCGAAGPAGQCLPDAVHQQLGCDEVLARREQPVQPPHPFGQRAGGDLAGERAGRAPWRQAVQQGLAGPGEVGAQGGDGVPFHRRTAGEADVLEFADRRAGAVAADQVTAAPPGALRAAGVGRDARGLLLHAVDPAVHGDPHPRLAGEGGAQGAGEHVLRDVQRGGLGLVEKDLAHHLLAPHRPPSGPVGAGLGEGHAGQPFQQGGGVLAQDDGARGARFVLAGAFVQDDAGHVLARQSQGEREPDGPRSHDDHRVHGAAPPARSGDLRDVGEQGVGAGCTITERMQPIAAAPVK
jgi:hypothetical protein